MNTATINTIVVSGISKSFNNSLVVDHISFDIKPGEVFGLIGPNGARKTTTIRTMIDIIKPDSGEVIIHGEKFNEGTKDNIGYLPEERGLYRKLTVADSLLYLAALKGVNSKIANIRMESWLELTNMISHKNKKIEELSRGMGQIIQFLATVIHDPQIVILDEPFSGLDPVNTEMLKDIISELKKQGKAVILSTHRMNEVEELCDRILMINKGKNVLYGEISNIKARYSNNSVLLECEGELPDLKGITGRRDHRNYIELFLDQNILYSQILKQLIDRGVTVNRFEVSTPSLNDIFLQLVDSPNE